MAAPMSTHDFDNKQFLKQGAEAKVYKEKFYDKCCISKERFSKAYRHPSLDKSLTLQRLKGEIRAMNKCRNLGIRVPVLYFVDTNTSTFYMEEITNSQTVRDYIIHIQSTSPDDAVEKLTPLATKIGQILGRMHRGKVIHGDLTTSNMLLSGNPDNLDIVLIDFGLSFLEGLPEDKGVDLYVFERALLSTHPNTEQVFEIVLDAYKHENKKEAPDVISKLEEVRMRGRKRTMVG
ncbi:EKC/KEOPS complex subunit TP53RK-like [Ruditapes philippinarum]|uniref:EKC/KEOPS complex subunit TP53RK-like n=1 Tax=Ruditapes philippinarum TaxID=129788 RepID=UPI00295A9DFB|nr:EKC/KEOPS complex subunit TP53RK-like [Ruditapes philippinarum]